jgi:SAM-dependent methyltransferase
MAIPDEYPFIRYLAAKKGVDDHALNRRVLHELETALTNSDRALPLDVLEVGAGIGTMLERLAGWGILKNAHYEAIDIEPGLIGEAARLVPLRARDHGFIIVADPDPGCAFCLERDGARISVRFEVVDLHRFIKRERGRHNRDLLIAHAFLDLVDLSRILPGLISLTKPGGLLSLTLNFDGLTILEPPVDAVFDGEIVALYHQSMDSRVIAGQPSGDSRTGRHLLTRLRELGVEILAAGSSDWVVFPGSGGYSGDEAYFLHFIVNLIEVSLKGHPCLDPDRFSRWIGIRHSQIERCEMVLIAHQIDLLGRVGEQQKHFCHGSDPANTSAEAALQGGYSA